MDDDGECTEETWWAAALTGDGEAFGQIFDRHHGWVYRHAVRLVDSRADVEDVVASTFLELWRRREDVRMVNGSALAWLLVTASNVARNMRRSRRRYSQLLAQLLRSPDVPDHAGEVIDRDVFGAISPTLAAGLRAALVSRVAASRIPASRRRARRRPLFVGLGLSAGLLLAGGSAAAISGLLGGADEVTTYGDAVTQTFTGTAEVDLGPRPASATHVTIALECLTAGTFAFADGASGTCWHV